MEGLCTILLSVVKHSMKLQGKGQCHVENRMMKLQNFDLLIINYNHICYAIKGCINMKVQNR